jgi:hypothetical protein
MKNVILLLSTLTCLYLAACKKEILHSTWTVNGDGFSTNKVAARESKGSSGLETDDKENGFSMGRRIYGLPGPGVHQISIDYQSNNPMLLFVSFYYKGAHYSLSPNNSGSLIATAINAKMHYEMPAAWFKNYTNPLDSVLISATLIQP